MLCIQFYFNKTKYWYSYRFKKVIEVFNFSFSYRPWELLPMSHVLHWVLLKVPRPQTYRAAQHVPGGGQRVGPLSDNNMENMSIDHSG